MIKKIPYLIGSSFEVFFTNVQQYWCDIICYIDLYYNLHKSVLILLVVDVEDRIQVVQEQIIWSIFVTHMTSLTYGYKQIIFIVAMITDKNLMGF